MATTRSKTTNVRMLPAEHSMLHELAEHEGISISEWIRNQVRREHALTFERSRKRPQK